MQIASGAPKGPGNGEANSPISFSAMRIVSEALNPKTSVNELANLAAQDPGFALRVLSAVNSAAFGVSFTVSDVRQAAGLLGIRGLKNIALSLALSDMVPLEQDGNLLLTQSIRRAVAARLIAERLGYADLDRYFTAGLFLEVGLLALARHDLPTAAMVARLPSAQRCVFERASGLAPHSERGAQTAKAFKLDAETTQAVLEHHADTIPRGELASVCWASERVAAVWEGGNTPDLKEAADAAVAALGIERFVELYERLPTLVARVGQGFQREIPAQETLQSLTDNAARSLVELNQNYEVLVRRLEHLIEEKEQLAQELKVANRQLTQLAATDGLTELPNKRAFQREMVRALARSEREDTWLSLVLADVDFFKKVNDTHGHLAGDDVLKAFAAMLRDSLRAGDFVARYGGEEFVVLLPATPPEGAVIVAERIRATVEGTRINATGAFVSVTASFGVASVRGSGARRASQALIAHADDALYTSKREGRNRVTLASSEPIQPGQAIPGAAELSS